MCIFRKVWPHVLVYYVFLKIGFLALMCKYDILYKYILFSVWEIEEFLMRLLSHLTLKASTSQNSETHSSSLSSYFQYWKIRVICHFSENCKISISLSIVKFNADGYILQRIWWLQVECYQNSHFLTMFFIS